MSLVYEALQKAEREKQRKTGILPPTVVRPEPTTVPSQEGNNKTALPLVQPIAVAAARSYQPWLFGLIACVSVVALVAIVYLVANATKPGPATATTVTNTITTTTAAPAIAAAAAPAELPPLNPVEARFRITGIMRDPEGKYGAVLNGKVVYEGFYVDGATVKSIAHDRAILDVGGREEVVRLY